MPIERDTAHCTATLEGHSTSRKHTIEHSRFAPLPEVPWLADRALPWEGYQVQLGADLCRWVLRVLLGLLLGQTVLQPQELAQVVLPPR